MNMIDQISVSNVLDVIEQFVDQGEALKGEIKEFLDDVEVAAVSLIKLLKNTEKELKRTQRIIMSAGLNLEKLWDANKDTLPNWAVELIDEAKKLELDG